MMNVLFCGQIEEAELARWRSLLAAAMPEAQWLDLDAARRRSSEVHAAVVANPAPGSLQGFPALRLIQSLWAGVDRLLADATLPAHVPIARMVDPAMNAAMAETALWATLALHRGFFDYAARQRERRWLPHAQTRADETQVLVLGYGQMGRCVAQAIAQHGYRVSAWRSQPADEAPGPVAVHAGEAALWALLPRAHIVINLLPLTPATHALLGARLFAALPRGASIANLARGAHLVDDDLLSALQGGQLRHAVLDVYHTEPLPPEHPFWAHPQVTVLPHAAAMTDPRSAAAVAVANLRALRDGRAFSQLVERGRGY